MLGGRKTGRDRGLCCRSGYAIPGDGAVDGQPNLFGTVRLRGSGNERRVSAARLQAKRLSVGYERAPCHRQRVPCVIADRVTACT